MATPISRETCNLLRADIEEAMKQVAEKHGLSFRFHGGMAYNPGQFARIGVEFCAVTTDGEVALDRAEWDMVAERYGMNKEWFGQTFKDDRGDTFTITGANLGRPKNIVRLRRNRDGSSRVCPAQFVIRHMAGVS